MQVRKIVESIAGTNDTETNGYFLMVHNKGKISTLAFGLNMNDLFLYKCFIFAMIF